MNAGKTLSIFGLTVLAACGSDTSDKSGTDPTGTDSMIDLSQLASAYDGTMTWEERDADGNVLLFEADPEDETVTAFVSHDGRLSFDGFADSCAVHTKPGTNEIPWQVCGVDAGTIESGHWGLDGDTLSIEFDWAWTDTDTGAPMTATLTFDGTPNPAAVYGHVDPASVPQAPLEGEVEGKPFEFVSGRAIVEYGDTSIELFAWDVDDPCTYDPRTQDELWIRANFEGDAENVDDLRAVSGPHPSVTVSRTSESGSLGYHVHRGQVRIENNYKDVINGGMWVVSHEGDTFVAGEFSVPVCEQ